MGEVSYSNIEDNVVKPEDQVDLVETLEDHFKMIKENYLTGNKENTLLSIGKLESFISKHLPVIKVGE